jgi:D-aminopeptidase
MRAILFLFFLFPTLMSAQPRPRDHGLRFGVLPTGPYNAITDVEGVRVGHITLIEGESIRTGVTVVLPHSGNIFQEKVPAAIYIGNGFGKLMGYSQVKELGELETPIALTNTLSVPEAAAALIEYTLAQAGNEQVRSVNALVGETNDGALNDIRGRHVRIEHVRQAIRSARGGPVEEGSVGAGTGTVCFGFKGGIGTASRRLPENLGGYTVGVLVQTNFGGVLTVAGAPVGEELEQYVFRRQLIEAGDGSCMIVVATDAPLDARNLERLAKRAFLGLGRAGGIASNGSGDYVVAFSTDPGSRILYQAAHPLLERALLSNAAMSPLFLAAIEATEEAIINSLFAAGDMRGNGVTVPGLPIERVLEILREYGRLD